MVAVPVAPTPLLRVKADAASAVMAPTAGTLTKAATVSLLVSIFRPVLAVAVTAAMAARVKPVQVTVTAPAAKVDDAPRVMVIASVEYADVPAAVVGDVMAHGLAAAAVTCPAGKVRVTLFSVG